MRYALLLLVLAVAVGMARAMNTATTGEGEAIAPVPPNPPAALGTTLHTNGWAWTVTDAKSLGATLRQTFDTRTIDGRWMQITVHWRNETNDARRIPVPALVDSQGRTFEPDGDAAIWHVKHENRCDYDRLNPGLGRTCIYLYPLPWDADNLVLDYRGDRAALR